MVAAEFPEAHVDPAGPDPAEPPAPAALLDPDGAHVLGPPTVDSDADGRPDTAVVTEPDGLVLGTDLDGDARADVLTRIAPDGSATTTGPDGPDWDEGWVGEVPPAPTIDPVTGRWVRD
ncbi:DUF6802 family protein [Actinomycetospora straminea]|uniref:DUF6802 domain-containing protein n=1 Tax=Actinomycetospora straminea TaxID=663607 RepID=A0ABP9ESQ7_9PSEU|nr:DUF6802 family protein [Actinomycetospora straminea]MDD7934041.1 hypothetical protein [Actinomycetospora straminea]